MKSRYLTPVAVAALTVLGASGAMAASHVSSTMQAKTPLLQQVSTAPAATHTQAARIEYQNSSVGALPAAGEVRLQGEVASKAADGSFMLKDSSGSIKVEQPHNSLVSPKDNATITVYGRVEGSGTDKYIAANRIVSSLAPPGHPRATTTE